MLRSNDGALLFLQTMLAKKEGTKKRRQQDRGDLQWLPLSDGASTDHYNKGHSDCSVRGVYDAQSISCTIKTSTSSSPYSS